MRILFLGDITGRPGRTLLAQRLESIRRETGADLVLANAENASGGLGLTAKTARELFSMGLDGVTSGNHVWRFKDIHTLLARETRLVRPANYPPGAPGRGWTLLEKEGLPPVAMVNLQGRTFMEPVDCPFRKAAEVLEEIGEKAKTVVVDFHAEATSEKRAMGFFLDGRVSVVAGTHTHVLTADAQVLPGGTAYVTDLGMCGPKHSCLGMDQKAILTRYVTGLPARFEVSKAASALSGALFDIDDETGRARSAAIWSLDPDEG